jgi:PAS domain S-box-containing protein
MWESTLISSSTKAGAMTFGLAVFFLIFGCCGSSLAQSDLAGKKVLILHAWEANLPMSTETNKALSRVFNSGGIPAFNQSFECLDLRRNPGPKYKKFLAEKIRLQYGHHKPDLIIAVNPIAMRFATDDCRDVFADIPILALMLPTGYQVPQTGRRVISHFPTLDIVRTLDIALKLVPHAKRVYVANGSYETDIAFENQVRRVSKKWEGRLQFLYLSSMPFEDMLAAVSKAPPDSIVLTLGFARDVSGELLTTPTAIRQISQASAAPVFGIADVALGYGIAGGFLSSYEFIGTKAGELTLDILRGTWAPENIPAILDVPAVPMFDWRELRRWNLSTGDLPEGSIVVNREVTPWDFGYYIIGILIFCLAETALIIFLVAQIRRKNVAEQSLRKSEERLSLAAASAEARLWELDLDSEVIWITERGREFYGLASGEELTLTQFLSLVHPDDRKRVREGIEAARSGKDLSIEYRVEPTPGNFHWITSLGRLSVDSSGKKYRITGASIDVTQRKRMELQLGESQTLLSALVDSTSDMIWSVDSERFGLLTFNRGLYEYFLNQRGIQIEVGMRPEDLFPTDDFVQTWRKFYLRALEKGSFTTEYSVYAGTRTLRLNLNRLKRNDVVFGVSVFGQDITDRIRAEEAIRESEANYRRLYESMMDGYVLVDMDGRILKYNESYRAMTGYSSDELLGLTYRDITPEKWHAAEKEIIEEQVLVRGYSEVYEKEYRNKDGTVIPIELRTFLLKDETGNSIGMWAIVRDITARKLMESEARKLREELAHITRVSTLGELTSTLAHEINQPLAAILTNAQAAQRFLSQDQPDMKEVSEILGDIIRDDNRAAGVIRQIRSLLKKEEIRYEPLSMNEVIEEILNVVRNDTALMTVSIKTEFDPSLPAVWGDRIQLQQVILNVVLNAAEAMRDAGSDPRRLIVRTSKKDGRFAEVSIRDVGPGIRANPVSRLFDAFYTTKAGGMGMGLAISKDIVRSHGGEIWAENNPDIGTTFSFTVPFDSGVRP